MNFRVKNFIVSFLFPFVLILFLKAVRFEGFLLYGTLFVGLIIEYFLSFWLLNYNVTPLGFITILLLPVILFGSFVLVYYYFIVKLNLIFEILLVGVFFIFFYYLMSTQNILNLSQFKNISLAQAASTTNNFYTVVTFFLSTLALFLLPDLPYLARFYISVILFAFILVIFVLLHSLDKLQYLYSVFFYTIFVTIISILYMLGWINSDKVLLVSIILGLVFRGILILLHYSSRKILSIFDYAQILLELGIISFLLDFISKK